MNRKVPLPGCTGLGSTPEHGRGGLLHCTGDEGCAAGAAETPKRGLPNRVGYRDSQHAGGGAGCHAGTGPVVGLRRIFSTDTSLWLLHTELGLPKLRPEWSALWAVTLEGAA